MWRFCLADSMGSHRLSVILCSLFLLSMAPLMPVTADESDSWHNHVVISEILVSASSEEYDGVDWNGDGHGDLLLGSMGDTYRDDAGGGVWLFPGAESSTMSFGAPITLVQPSPKGAHEPTRPDAGLYIDLHDHEGDGDHGGGGGFGDHHDDPFADDGGSGRPWTGGGKRGQ